MTYATCKPIKNALILLSDSGGGHVPQEFKGSVVEGNTNGVAIGTRSEVDGETTISATDNPDYQRVASGFHLAYSGLLSTPSRVLIAQTVELETLLTLQVKCEKVEIEIWLDDYKEPSQVLIVVGNKS